MGFEDFSVKEQILSTPGISKTGNLARGISFGNTQNVFVNSALNLQLEGQLAEKIHLTAAISDQNMRASKSMSTLRIRCHSQHQVQKFIAKSSRVNSNCLAG